MDITTTLQQGEGLGSLGQVFPFVTQVHVDQELLIYEAFPYDQQQAQNLKVRFKKVRAPIRPCLGSQ